MKLEGGIGIVLTAVSTPATAKTLPAGKLTARFFSSLC